MFLLHLRNGTVVKSRPSDDVEQLRVLDSFGIKKDLSRVAITNDRGGRLDLPSIERHDTIWLDGIFDGDSLRGESVNFVRRGRCYRFSMFYSDGRFVVELF